MNYGTTQKGVQLSMEVVGLDELLKVLKNIPVGAEAVAKKELEMSLADLQAKAQSLTPVDSSALKKSAFHEVNDTADGFSGIVGYAKLDGEYSMGKTPPYKYALRQHEDLSFKHPNGGQAKFLEQPFKENINAYTKQIGDAIKKEVGR